MRIVIFGLPYSANVGDGVIAECLAHELRRAKPGVHVDHVDLSGRNGFGAQTLRNRSAALAVLSALPLRLRQRLVIWRLGKMLAALRPGWVQAARGADLAVIGGGQLFSDADLNFCLKVAQAADVLRAARTPVAVYGVGVSRNWTRAGTALFNRVFSTDLRSVGVRDPASAEAWADQTAGAGPEPVLTRDPGLLAASCYTAPVMPGHSVGVCVTDPKILAYHADGAVAGRGIDFFAALTGALVAAGRDVTLFCNGAEEDRAALARLAAHPQVAALVAKGRVRAAPAPGTPTDLAAIIAACDGVIAHRLHACILAYAFAVPCVGLGWDRKLESFFTSVGAARFFIGGAGADATEVAQRCEAAVAAGVDPGRHAEVLAESRAGAAALLTLVNPESAPPPGAASSGNR
tara:strand:- start:1843 stop:3057 length:1215 start_codon:yes stop_codon:yes gene_type:complete